MEKHLQAIGFLNIGLGAASLLGCIVTLILCGGPEGVLLISAREGSTVTTTEGFVTACAIAYLVVLAGPLILLGLGIRKHQQWARNLGIVISIFALPLLPVGTAIGVYNLWVLTSFEVEPLFRG